MSYLGEQQTQLRAAQTTEALLRMKLLGIHENAIREFLEEGKLNYSEQGILFWLDEKEREMVKEIQDMCGGLVYHVIKTNTTIGLMYSFLYVSKYPEEWETDDDDLREGYCVAAVKNMDWDITEFGSIEIKPLFGGVLRTA